MTDIKLLQKLRLLTGIGILECKKALLEANGNIKLAIIYMRKKGILKAIKKSSNITSSGIIAIRFEKFLGSMVELTTETDFVTQTQDFINFADKIVLTALEENINNIQDLNSRFENQRIKLISKMNENINIKRFFLMKGENIGGYLHNKKIGVLSSFQNIDEKLKKQICMHIAANDPQYLHKKDIAKEVLENEYQIQLESSLKIVQNKNLAQKIALGKMKKFFDEIILMNQNFIFEPNKKIHEIIEEKKSKIVQFMRFQIGYK